MEKIKVTKGQVLHKRGDEVRLIEIVLSGGLLMTDGHDVEVRLGSGAVAGAVYSPGEEYDFDYVASEDSTLITMEYNADEDLAEAVTSTAAIAPAMAAASMEHTSGVLDALVSIEEAATELCKEIRYNYNDYKFLCAKLQKDPVRFPLVEALTQPEPSALTSGWQFEIVKAFCEQHKTTENVLTTAAFGYLLSAYTLKKEVLFTTVYNGRRDPRCKGTVSMFVTTLPVLCRRGVDLSVEEYLSGLKEQLLGSMASDLYSFAELSADTGLTSDVQFVWQGDMLSLPAGSTLKLKREKLPFIATGDVLSAQLFPEEDQLVFQVQYHADRYSEEYIARLAGCMNQVLKDMMVKDKLSDRSSALSQMKSAKRSLRFQGERSFTMMPGRPGWISFPQVWTEYRKRRRYRTAREAIPTRNWTGHLTGLRLFFTQMEPRKTVLQPSGWTA